MVDYSNCHGGGFTSEESKRLFSDEMFSVEVMHALKDGSVFSSVAQDIATLEAELSVARTAARSLLRKVDSGFEDENVSERGAQSGNYTIFFLQQSDSWSRIHMSHEAFQKLVSACFVSNDIYSFVSAFGSRVKDSDTNFGGYFRRLHHSLDNGYHPNATFCEKAQIDMASGETLRSVLQVEFCFSVRYPEKHGRDLENPWVMRRILVYQQHNLDAQNSTWIFLQCPSNLRKRLVSTLSVPERTKFSFIEHTKLHMVIFGEIFKGWRAYVNHLETVVEDLDEIACFSRVGRAHPFDYSAKFADAQLLQQYIRIILKAKEAIETSLSVIEGLKMHVNQRVQEDQLRSSYQDISIELEQFTRQMQLHRRSVATLAKYSQSLQTLLLNLLSYRNDETIHKNGEIVHQDGEMLRRIASSTHTTSEEQRKLLQSTVKDYRIMKSLTFIAMLYLPANLIAAMFNSNLLSLPSASGTASEHNHILGVSKGIWLFFVLSISLTVVTILAAVPWGSLRIPAFLRRSASPIPA